MDEKTTPDLTADDAVARVRAADLASGAEPDRMELRRTVDERIAAGDATDELAERRARRWTAWPARLAGVAAATLVVGMAGGYALGSASGGVAAQPPITLQGPAPMGAGGAEMAREGDGATDMATDMAIWPGYWGRTVFTTSGLSDAGGSAQALAFDASGTFSEQTITSLAMALGVEGTPSLQDWMWTVGPNDGSGASVQLFADGTSSVYYYDPTKDVWRCDAGTLRQEEETRPEEGAAATDGNTIKPEDDVAPPADDGAPSTGDATPPADDVVPPDEMSDPGSGGGASLDPCTQQDLGPAPKGDAAVAVLRTTLAAIGLDANDFEYVAEDYDDASWTYVTAYQVVDGQRTGMAWGSSLSGAGLQSLNGSLAPLVSLGEYDVVSPSAAVLRLSDPRFGSSGGGYYATEGGDERVMMDAPTTPSVPVPVSPGARIGWPVNEVTITQARLGLAMHTQPDGAALLVPSYELTSSDGAVWSVIAVADAQLDFSAVS